MKKITAGMVAGMLGALLLAGCAGAEGSSSVPEESVASSGASLPAVSAAAAGEAAAVGLIRDMMALDYPAMTVADFNGAIQALCEEAGTNVFQVVSDAYDHFSVYDETGEFVSVVIGDDELEAFLQTTLEYSAQEIFGEPVHLGSIAYMTMPGVTAAELDRQRAQMSPGEWDRYFEDNIADIEVLPILSYEIEADTPDAGGILVSERDERLNAVHAAIKAYVLGLDEEAVMAETLEADIQGELDRLSAEYSDDKLAVACRVQSLERDI